MAAFKISLAHIFVFKIFIRRLAKSFVSSTNRLA
jgi:hypothetical protein